MITWTERVAGYIAITIALILVFGIFGSFTYLIYLPWLAEGSSLWTSVLFGFVCGCLGLGLWSYAAAIGADNRVNTCGTEADCLDGSFCLKCNRTRPARAHHCSICQECILRMDHHCPWINNCVGERNHGHYLRFLVYCLSGMFMLMALMMGRLGDLYQLNSIDRAVTLAVLMADLIGCAILSLMVGVLATVQFANVFIAGKTTIEGVAKVVEEACNQGWLINGKTVFGMYVLLWPFPLPLSLNPLFVVENDGHVTPQPLAPEECCVIVNRPQHSRFRQGSADDGGGFIVPSPNYQIKVETQ